MGLFNIIRFLVRHPLNRGQAQQAIWDFLRWQVGTRLVPGPVVFEWLDGVVFVARRGDKGLTGNIYCGLHEFEDMAFVLHVLRDDDLFVDVGSNAGSYTLLACGVAGARGFAIEPVHQTFSRLVDNVHINRLAERVTCLEAAASNEEAMISISTGHDTGNHVVVDENEVEGTISVKTITLDRLLEDEMPTVLKIDVEGFETKVIEGAREVMRKESLIALIVEVNGSGARYGHKDAALAKLITDCGFKPYRYDPFTRSLDLLQGLTSTGNTLFVRNLESVRSRVQDAPLRSLRGIEV